MVEEALKKFNVTDAAVRVSYFIGSETYNLVCDAGISKVLKNHYNPDKLEIAAIYKF